MKKLFTILGLTIGAVVFAQNSSTSLFNEENEIEMISLEVSIDSAEDLKETFKIQDLKELMEIGKKTSVTFRLICKGEVMSNGKPSSMSYEIENGKLSDEDFLKLVKKIRQSAINYYDNK